MFDKLEDLLHHYEELMNTLSEPDVANDPNRFRKLMKEQSDLQPIVDAYKEFCFFRRIRTMIRTLSLKFVQVQVEKRLRCLRLKFIVCMCIMQRADAGKWKHLRQTRLVSVV